MLSRTSLRRLCLLGAVICFGVLLIPNFRMSQTATARNTQVDMGLPFSPWFHFEDERTEVKSEVEQDGETVPSFTSTFRTVSKVEFVSWSALSMLAGIGFLIGAKYARQRDVGPKVA